MGRCRSGLSFLQTGELGGSGAGFKKMFGTIVRCGFEQVARIGLVSRQARLLAGVEIRLATPALPRFMIRPLRRRGEKLVAVDTSQIERQNWCRPFGQSDRIHGVRKLLVIVPPQFGPGQVKQQDGIWLRLNLKRVVAYIVDGLLKPASVEIVPGRAIPGRNPQRGDFQSPSRRCIRGRLSKPRSKAG
jgi:hypothetical protein